MKPVVPGGFLVAIEGVDGAGKTSVSALLAQYCGERGLLCTLSKEPTGLSYGRKLRESAKAGRLGPEDELDLFLRDRADHAARSIRPALEAGHAVILDRYYWSTAAYQGARGIDPFKIIADNEAFAPKPDLFLLLDIAPETGLERVRIRGDIPNKFERVKSLSIARDIFNRIHEHGGANSVRIDASVPLRHVHMEALRNFQSSVVALIEERLSDPHAVEEALQLFQA